LNTSSFAKQVLGSKTPGRKRLNSLIVALVKLIQQANHAGRLNKPLGVYRRSSRMEKGIDK
jgi:hypothetical protein